MARQNSSLLRCYAIVYQMPNEMACCSVCNGWFVNRLGGYVCFVLFCIENFGKLLCIFLCMYKLLFHTCEKWTVLRAPELRATLKLQQLLVNLKHQGLRQKKKKKECRHLQNRKYKNNNLDSRKLHPKIPLNLYSVECSQANYVICPQLYELGLYRVPSKARVTETDWAVVNLHWYCVLSLCLELTKIYWDIWLR